MEQEFDDYLKSKKIDPVAFKSNEPDTFLLFKSEFDQLHPKSFTLQKLFYINIIRRKYTYKASLSESKKTNQPQAVVGAKPTTPTGAIKKPTLKPNLALNKAATVKKPVVKPQMPGTVAKQDSEGDSSEVKENQPQKKPVLHRPVIKPKVPPKTKE